MAASAQGAGEAQPFGNLLRQHRLAAGLTQEQLAERAGLGVRSIQDLERGVGRPLRRTAAALADALRLKDNALDDFRLAAAPAPRRRHASSVLVPANEPPLRLPNELGSLIGRERELAALTSSLRPGRGRLHTLVGPGGVGKTRLAVVAAQHVQTDFAQGSVLVDLAPVRDPLLVLPTIARALRLPEVGAVPLAEQLRGHLRARELLLVLDNFEQVVTAGVSIADLLEDCPRLVVLATSRTPLRVRGEHEIAVRPLALPEASEIRQLAVLARVPAMALFIERARAVRADFELTTANARSVAAICARLDGLPLALELAAARLRLFTPEALLARLDHTLAVLVGGRRDAPERQQTLRNTLAWSHNLLTPSEQELFRRLAVFAGGWTVDAARALGEAAPAVTGHPAELLEALVEQSLVQVGNDDSGEPRFGLLETVREYAWEQLRARGEEAAISRAHAAHYTALLACHEACLKSPRQAASLRVLEAEMDNIRAAWSWAVEHDDDASIGKMLDGFGLFCQIKGWLQEGEAVAGRAAAALAAAAGAGNDDLPRERAILVGRLLGWQQRFCNALARYDRADSLLERSLELLRLHGAEQELALSLEDRGNAADRRGRYEEAARLFQQALARARETGDGYRAGVAINRLAGIAFDVGDYVAARGWWQEGLATFGSIGNRHGVAVVLGNLGEVASLLGDYSTARRQLDEAATLLHEMGDIWRVFSPLDALGTLAVAEGRYGDAQQLHQEVLAIARRVGDRRRVATSLMNLGAVGLHTGDAIGARALLAQSLSTFDEIGYRRGIGRCLNVQAQLAYRLGDGAAAECLATDALAIAHDIGDRHGAGAALHTLGDAACLRGAWAPAAGHLRDAFVTLTQTGVLPEILAAVVSMAALLDAATGRGGLAGASEANRASERAIELLAFALRQPNLWSDTRRRASRLLEGVATRMAAPELEAAQARGTRLSFNEVLGAFGERRPARAPTALTGR